MGLIIAAAALLAAWGIADFWSADTRPQFIRNIVLIAILLLVAGAAAAQVPWAPLGWTGSTGVAAPSIDPNAGAISSSETTDGGTINCTITTTNPSTLYAFVISNGSMVQQATVAGPGGVTMLHRPSGTAATGSVGTTDSLDEWYSSAVVSPGTYALTSSNIGIAANYIDTVCFAVNNSTGWDANVAVPTAATSGSSTTISVSGIATSGSPVMVLVWGTWLSASASCSGHVAPGAGFTLAYANIPATSVNCMVLEYKVGTASSATIVNDASIPWRAMADAID